MATKVRIEGTDLTPNTPLPLPPPPPPENHEFAQGAGSSFELVGVPANLVVSNLNDTGVGSFRAAAEAVGPRIITFTVNGTINLESRIEIQSDCIIDGSTAPGLGVCIAGHRVEFRGTNICIRYLRFRLGISPFVTPKSSNPLIFTDDGIIPTDIVIDHCSVSWSRDTNIGSFNGAVDEDSASGLLAPRFRRISIQYCIISHPLRDAGHPAGS